MKYDSIHCCLADQPFSITSPLHPGPHLRRGCRASDPLWSVFKWCQVQCPPVPWSSGRSTQGRSGHVPHSVMCIALCSSPRARCTPRPRPQSRRRSRARDSDRVKQDVTRRLPCLHRRDPRARANQQSMPCRRNAIRSLSVTVRTRNRLILL